jgi:hypothetical protein
MRVATLKRSFEATFEGVDDTGRLIALTAAGREVVSAGEVFSLGSAA